jgi:hypothetical protein
MNYPTRVKAGLCVAVALSVWGAISYYGFETDFGQSRDPYRIAAQSRRLEGLSTALPEDAVVGYFTDLEQGSVAASSAFNAAQYALAPRLLRQDAVGPRVLGNFSHPVDFAALGARRGLHIERDFGQGVILYRKQSLP